MPVRQRSKYKKYGSIAALLVSVATIAQFGIKPLWGMEVQIQGHDVKIGRLQEATERIDERDKRIESKVDRLLELFSVRKR